uniref:SFRICE_015612 n=1 Tax=Spodoptera frugiperda TaxID=7108 RepID=A0A2H1V7B4_SPOFR
MKLFYFLCILYSFLIFFALTQAADRRRCLKAVAEDNRCNTTVQAYFFVNRRFRARCLQYTIPVCNTTIQYYQNYDQCLRECQSIRRNS